MDITGGVSFDINSEVVGRINNLPTGAAILDNETPNPIEAFGSHHQKLLIVKGKDGLIGFCGGVDINRDRIDVTQPDHGEPLHDVHCRIVGPSAWDLLETFRRRWRHNSETAAIDKEARGDLCAEPSPKADGSDRITIPPPGSSSTGGTCSVIIARTFNPVNHRTTDFQERDIQQLLLHAIGNARRFIYIEDQYLISLEAAAALRAALPNIDHLTRLITASELSDVPCIWKFRRDFYDLLRSGRGKRSAENSHLQAHYAAGSATLQTWRAYLCSLESMDL